MKNSILTILILLLSIRISAQDNCNLALINDFDNCTIQVAIDGAAPQELPGSGAIQMSVTNFVEFCIELDDPACTDTDGNIIVATVFGGIQLYVESLSNLVGQCITIDCGGALPLDVLKFEANYDGEQLKVQLGSTNRSGVSHIQIRESDGKENNWRVVHTFNDIPDGNGVMYNTWYGVPERSGLHYYQAKIIDLDGTFAETKVVSVYVPGEQDIIYQLGSSFRVSEQGNVDIYNTQGQLLGRQKCNPGADYNLPSGISFLRFSTKAFNTTLKVISH